MQRFPELFFVVVYKNFGGNFKIDVHVYIQNGWLKRHEMGWQVIRWATKGDDVRANVYGEKTARNKWVWTKAMVLFWH